MKYELLKNKFLVIDTDVLINTSKYFKFYSPIFSKLAENEAESLLDEFVRFEFLRKADSRSEFEKLETFLKTLIGGNGSADLKISSSVINSSLEIANLYSWKNIKNPSPTDCILGAHLKKYNSKNSLFLLTENHKDFPGFIFDRVGFETIEVDDGFHTLGFYCFNPNKFELLMQEYNS